MERSKPAAGEPVTARSAVITPARSQSERPAPGLVEREGELHALCSQLAALERGQGGTLIIDAPAGYGKTALLDFTAQLAAGREARVLRSAPGPLEAGLAFGVIRTLFGPFLLAAPAADLRELDGGPAATALRMLRAEDHVIESSSVLAHSLLWLCATLARHAPLVLAVDDGQWADRESLELLSYLARRAITLPLMIIVGVRGRHPRADADLLGLLAAAPGATLMHLRPLSRAGAVRLVHTLAPHVPVRTCCAWRDAVDGDPWLLTELARQQPGTISEELRSVIKRRLAELEPSAHAVALALAVLDGEGDQHVVAEVSSTAIGELSHADHELAGAGLTLPAGGAMHPLIRSAIFRELSGPVADRLHRSAAQALVKRDARLAADHLLHTQPRAESWVTRALLEAAGEATEAGSPERAERFLHRALSERAADDDRVRMLCDLATVLFDAGRPHSHERLQEALRETQDDAQRTEVLARLAALGLYSNPASDLGQDLERQLDSVSDALSGVQAQAAMLDTLLGLPDATAERVNRTRTLREAACGHPLMRQVALAHQAFLDSGLGMVTAEETAAMALEALEGGRLLKQAQERSAYHLCVRVLEKAGAVAEAELAIGALREYADERGSLRLRVGAAWYEAELRLRTGAVSRAEAMARQALELSGDERGVFTAGALEVLVYALAEGSQFEEAHERLRRCRFDDIRWSSSILNARARLSLAEGDFERAYDQARAAGEQRERQGKLNPTWNPWRVTASVALAHLGRRAEATKIADVGLSLARRFGARVPIARALHARAVAEPDPLNRAAFARAGLDLLRAQPGALDSARLQLELGSALLAAGERLRARDALRLALTDAGRAGASGVAARARRELVRTGLRPRRTALEGAAALTPRQREICELAAAGKTNKTIAAQLFLSVKTVETHLAASYRKLAVEHRDELAHALRA